MNIFQYIAICLNLLVPALMITLLLPSAASCRLSGGADLSYVDYDSRDNTRHDSASSLTQHYSLLYDSSGKLVNGRLGKYNVALGYEWLAFDTNLKSSTAASNSLSGSRGHLIYRGELLVDPKEVPFRLTLFSRDMNKSGFAAGLTSSQSQSDDRTSHYISVPPDIATGINNGMHIESGATLVMGVKNGMTNGYNEILRHFPMVMLDYRDLVNQDKSSITPVDNRLTRLAFVSLNKKDNWFHYRFTTYNDYVNASNNYYETQIQLGTVDQTLQRRWVDFTNWLQVSVDGQFTKVVHAQANENYEEFSLNLFGTARRQRWELRTFNNFTRYNEYNLDRITYTTSMPVYANGIISPTANWSAYAKYNDSLTDKGGDFNSVAGGYSIDVFRKSLFTLNQALNVEKITASSSVDTLAVSGSLGTASTPLYSRALSLRALYNIRINRYDDNGNTPTFLDQELNGTAGYNITNTLRASASQTNRFTNGISQRIDNTLPGAIVTSSQYSSPRANISDSGGSSYQSISTLSLLWTPKPRLNTSLYLSEDIYVTASGAKSNITKADARVDYTDGKLKLSSNTGYSTGGNVGEELTTLKSTNTVSYIFNRSLDAKVGFTYFRTSSGDNSVSTFNAEEAINYTLYQDGGMRRKLLEISEKFTSVDELVEKVGSIENAATFNRRTNLFQIGAKYYPLRVLMIAGGARYSLVNGFENDATNYYCSLSVKFKLLEAGLDYQYGINKTNNRVEKKITANVKKIF